MEGTLPEDYWWNTLIPLQYSSLRRALLKGKKGVVSLRRGVACLFPLEKIGDTNSTLAKILLLAMSGRKGDEVVGDLYAPKLRVHPPEKVLSIISSFEKVECVSVDVRWVAEEDELRFVLGVIDFAKRKEVYLLHIAYVNNDIYHNLAPHLLHYTGKCSITIEFREGLRHNTFSHPKVKMM